MEIEGFFTKIVEEKTVWRTSLPVLTYTYVKFRTT